MERVPETIAELKQWYIDMNLPPESVTRFFIGTNYKRAKAFGIYKDEITGEYVVYKNKADGTRSIRYKGEDEAYAVNELYQKLKDEIYNQKNNNPKNYNTTSYRSDNITYDENLNYESIQENKYNRKKNKNKSMIYTVVNIIIMYILVILLSIFFIKIFPQRGYYYYDNNYYYFQNCSWYKYDPNVSWKHIAVPKVLKKNHADYYRSNSYDYTYGIDNFKYSEYYKEPSTYSSSSSSYDWDSSSSWDSSYTDWDSDW